MKHQNPDCTNIEIGEWNCTKCFDYKNVPCHSGKFRLCLLCRMCIAKKGWKKHLPPCEEKFIKANKGL
mgnify:CR=1 FL=1